MSTPEEAIQGDKTPEKCDCLIYCGDDRRLRDGRVIPCEARREQERHAAIAAKRAEARLALHKLHNTTTIEDLVDAQALNIKWLHGELNRAKAQITEMQADQNAYALLHRALDLGWRLVPSEPTINMITAFHAEDGESACNKYRALLAAAPRELSNG